MEALDVFHPKRIADRILGMGDVVSLVEKAQEHFDEEKAKKLQKKLIKDQFTLSDFYDQIQQIKKMGNIKDLASMLPGVGKALRDVDIDNNAFKSVEAIILSMTPKERRNPAILNARRRLRIANTPRLGCKRKRDSSRKNCLLRSYLPFRRSARISRCRRKRTRFPYKNLRCYPHRFLLRVGR